MKSMPDTARLANDGALAFILAGDAIFTITNTKTGNRATYKVVKHADKDLWFVRYLAGADNDNDYRYLGIINERHNFSLTAKSAAGHDALVTRCFAWTWARLSTNMALPSHVEIWHEGRCGRCGRRLTVPESIASGFGPECIKKALAA